MTDLLKTYVSQIESNDHQLKLLFKNQIFSQIDQIISNLGFLNGKYGELKSKIDCRCDSNDGDMGEDKQKINLILANFENFIKIQNIISEKLLSLKNDDFLFTLFEGGNDTDIARELQSQLAGMQDTIVGVVKSIALSFRVLSLPL